jgi:HSP20 family protein
MSMTRYNPFDSTLPLTMHDAMDRLLEESFAPTWRTDLFGIGRGFPVDVYEDELNYVIEASLPGIKPDQLKVTATGNTITIRTTTEHDEKQEKKAESKDKKSGSYVRRERYHGEMTRFIDLPDPISPDKITATYKHGVLTLEVPKAGESKPKKIDINVEE